MALNPVIKFTTLFGLLAVELAVSLTGQGRGTLVHVLAGVFFLVSAFFVHRSFYGMRIRGGIGDAGGLPAEPPEPAGVVPDESAQGARQDAVPQPRPGQDPPVDEAVTDAYGTRAQEQR